MATPKTSKLDVAIAELAVLLKTAVSDIAEIKGRLSVMDEQFARKGDVETNRLAIEQLKRETADLRTNFAVTASKLSTWGIIGGIIITLLSAAISALQIHL